METTATTNALISVDEFTGLKVDRLESYDYLALSYFAARGLPGTERSNLEDWYAKRDAWAYRIQFETARHLYRFNENADPPTETSYGNSMGRFLCYMALQVLQEDCGVRYHPARAMNPGSCQPRNVFAHGIMDDDGEGGTCASMPVVYVSTLRRLGYPVHLVATRGHLFCRWESSKVTTIRWRNPDVVIRVPPDRFNFDGSGHGIAFHPDVYYETFPEPWTAPLERERRCYLYTKTARQALASMLFERGECFWDFGMVGEALKSFHFTCLLVPDDERYKNHHDARFREYAFNRIMLRQHLRERRLRLEPASQNQLGHPRDCKCLQCEYEAGPMGLQQLTSAHGPSCECFGCRRAVTAAAGVMGHPPACHCAGCRRTRNHDMPPPPGVPGFNPLF